jgi:transcriptional antiterminator NusG
MLEEAQDSNEEPTLEIVDDSAELEASSEAIEVEEPQVLQEEQEVGEDPLLEQSSLPVEDDGVGELSVEAEAESVDEVDSLDADQSEPEPEEEAEVEKPDPEPEEAAETELVLEEKPVGEQSETETVKSEMEITESEPAAVVEEAEIAELEAVADDNREWYVVHCYSGYENKVRHNLEHRIETMNMKDQIFDVVVPTEEEMEVKDGKRRTVERRVFPGYILVQMTMTEDSWYVVRNTPGVTGFVGMGNEPTPLRPDEVKQIIKRMEAEAPRIKVSYKMGQKVRIIDGPFNDFIGTVENIDIDKAKVRVMVSFFGRDTPVELDFLQVDKA